MIIFPAVDIQGGKAVRLKRGKKDESTIYADDPSELALRWLDAGANWLHIIDLDGAFSGKSDNRNVIEKIAAIPGISTQAGGGIRDLRTASAYLAAGVDRLIIGTLALEQPTLFEEMCQEFPQRIGVSLDASNGVLKCRGWLQASNLTISEAVQKLEQAGAAFIIYTDIERDGMQTGVNLSALSKLLKATSLPVIAAGGVGTFEDIVAIYRLRKLGRLEGAISGRAVCEGTLDLRAALEWIKSHSG